MFFFCVTYLPPLGKSDHCVLQATLDFQISQRPAHSRLRRLWACDKADFGEINKRLLAAEWPTSAATIIDEAWSDWKKVFFDIINKLIPSKVVAAPRPHTPWMTDTLRRLIKEKRAAFRKFKRSPSDESRSSFCSLRNKVTSQLRKAQRQYTQSLHRSSKLSNSPSSVRQFWHFVKRRTGKWKSTVIPDLVILPSPTDGNSCKPKLACSDVDKADLLNKFFT